MWYPTGTLDSDDDGSPSYLETFAWGSHRYEGTEYGARDPIKMVVDASAST